MPLLEKKTTFIKNPGQLPLNEDEHALLVGEPDWVSIPPDLGGGRANIVEVFTAPCPVYPQDRPAVKHYRLDNGMYVAESGDQFY